MSTEEAVTTFQVFAEQHLGCDPGMVPGGKITHCIRLCRECAERAGVGENLMTAAELAGGTIKAYWQPDELSE